MSAPKSAPNLRCLALCCALLAGVAGCVEVPALDDGISRELRKADYPTLQPIPNVLAQKPLPAESAEDVQEELEARKARLQRRAAALKQAQ